MALRMEKGAPGSGKGTLCKLLVDNHNVVHLSVGDILRDAAAQQAPDREIVEHVGAGTLVPAETLSAYVRRAMAIAERQDQDSMFLIDGAPRKMSQIKHLESTVRVVACTSIFPRRADVSRWGCLPSFCSSTAQKQRREDVSFAAT